MPRILAFVSFYVESQALLSVLEALAKLPNIEELYEVTGEFDIAALVSAADIEEFRDFLNDQILKIDGVKSTVTSIVMRSHKGQPLES